MRGPVGTPIPGGFIEGIDKNRPYLIESTAGWVERYAKGKGEAERVAKEADDRSPRVGDVWETGRGNRVQVVELNCPHHTYRECKVRVTELDDGSVNFYKPSAFAKYELISRAAKPERANGELRKGDRVLLRSVKWEGVVLLARECADGSGRTVVRVRWDHGGEAEYFAESLELVKASQ